MQMLMLFVFKKTCLLVWTNRGKNKYTLNAVVCVLLLYSIFVELSKLHIKWMH